MKKPFKIILSVFFAVLIVSAGITVFALGGGNLAAGGSKTASINEDSEIVYSFAPKSDGVYEFTAIQDSEYNLFTSLLLDGDELSAGYAEYGNGALSISCYCQKGNKYLLKTEAYGSSGDARVTISAARLYGISAVDFIPAGEYVYFESDYSVPDFSENDAVVISKDSGEEERYIFKNGDFTAPDGSALYDEIGEYPELIFDNDENGKLSALAFSFLGYTERVEISKGISNVESVSYKPIEPLIIVENSLGYLEENKSESYFYYFMLRPEQYGDELTVSYSDGRGAVTYTYREVDGSDCFADSDGNTLEADYRIYDSQQEKHWTAGVNYFTVEYMGAKADVPIKVIPQGWNEIDGKRYYYTAENKYLTFWNKIDGSFYYFDADGVLQTGWKTINGSKYYFDAGGAMKTGWQKLSGKWYYFNSNGVMLRGWQPISGKWYYFKNDGVMLSGWQKISNKWYYFKASGAMVTSWQKISNKWYYFNSSGAMASGWKKISGRWYYFDGSGAMKTGWLKSGGKWYYFNSSGAMVTGWQTINGKRYYFNSSGEMK